MNVLGVNCSTGCAYLALAEDGELTDGHVEYIDAPALDESSHELASVLDELDRAINEVRADKVVAAEAGGWADDAEDPCGVHPEDRPRDACASRRRTAADRRRGAPAANAA
jgi:hypothetical protein